MSKKYVSNFSNNCDERDTHLWKQHTTLYNSLLTIFQNSLKKLKLNSSSPRHLLLSEPHTACFISSMEIVFTNASLSSLLMTGKETLSNNNWTLLNSWIFSCKILELPSSFTLDGSSHHSFLISTTLQSLWKNCVFKSPSFFQPFDSWFLPIKPFNF